MKVTRSKQFKKDYKLALKQQKDISLLKDVVNKLRKKEKLSDGLKDHKLIGNLKKYRELHLESDWLLMYRIDDTKTELKLARLGSHSELYRK